jgi:hypothetical protein
MNRKMRRGFLHLSSPFFTILCLPSSFLHLLPVLSPPYFFPFSTFFLSVFPSFLGGGWGNLQRDIP